MSYSDKISSVSDSQTKKKKRKLEIVEFPRFLGSVKNPKDEFTDEKILCEALQMLMTNIIKFSWLEFKKIVFFLLSFGDVILSVVLSYFITQLENIIQNWVREMTT